MMKSYLRYEPKERFGVINDPQCNVSFDYTGHLAFTGAAKEISILNLRQAAVVKKLRCAEPDYPYKVEGEICQLLVSPDKTSVIAGYSDGSIRVYDFTKDECVATLRGHTTAITALTLNHNGTVLASGAADCDVVLWDLVSHAGLVKLRGHKNVVMGVLFLNRGVQQFLVSVSKDTLLKVWDLESNYCVQTVVGHRCEILSLMVFSVAGSREKDVSAEGDTVDEMIVLTGGADELLRGYRLNTGLTPSKESTEEEVLSFCGSVNRTFSNDNCVRLSGNSTGSLLLAQSSGKTVEFFKVRSMEEARKKWKRKMKRIKEKQGETPVQTQSSDVAPLEASTGPQLSDFVEFFQSIRCNTKIRGSCFGPRTSRGADGIHTEKVLIGLLNNSLELHEIQFLLSPQHKTLTAVDEAPRKVSVVDHHGHRSDVRVVCCSGDGNSIATAGNDGIKVWSAKTLQCVGSSLSLGSVLSCGFAPGGRFLVLGTKEGFIKIVDTGSGVCVFEAPTADEKDNNTDNSIWALAIRPDGIGFMTGGASKFVQFWDFEVAPTGLTAKSNRQLLMPADILSLCYSPTKSAAKLLLAAGLLDNTIKVFYDDSLKFFLSLYGHKLPVTSVDISSDCTLLISGSADKTIKIWGLDFGDCHRSLLAHQDTITTLRFQPKTHYFFSGSKDSNIKYWDADRFEQIQLLPGHKGTVWSLCTSLDGTSLFSTGQDRSIRHWSRGEDLVFVEEERERFLEAQVDESAFSEQKQQMDIVSSAENSALLTSTVGVTDSLKGGEALIEALDIAEQEVERQSSEGNEKEKSQNPLMQGLSPTAYLLKQLKRIKQADLEQALMVLPFHYVTKLIHFLIQMAGRGLAVEECTRCAIQLLRSHQGRILNTQSLLPEILALRGIVCASVGALREAVGVNCAGLRCLKRVSEDQQQSRLEAAVGADVGLKGKSKKRKTG